MKNILLTSQEEVNLDETLLKELTSPKYPYGKYVENEERSNYYIIDTKSIILGNPTVEAQVINNTLNTALHKGFDLLMITIKKEENVREEIT